MKLQLFAGEEYGYLQSTDPRTFEDLPIHCIDQTFTKADMTDGGSTAGTIDLTAVLPKGAIPIGWVANVITAFTGDTSAVLKAGISGDDDRFSADTAQSVFTTGLKGSMALAADALDGVNADQTVRLTITSAADFTNVAAGGKMRFRLYYIQTSAAFSGV